MAPRSAPVPSKWYTDLPSSERRHATLRYLRDALQGRPSDARNSVRKYEPGLREIYPGFDPSDGFDLRDVKTWSRAQYERVQGAAKSLRAMLASPYVVVTPKNRKQRYTLRYFTEQISPHQRRFIVHVQTPDARVRLVKQRDRKPLALQIQRPERFGGFGQMRFWMFRDYNGGRGPALPEEFIEATRRMLPDMPDWGYFALWSKPNGVITISQPKNSLLRVIQRFFNEGESFGGNKFDNAKDILQGWVLQGSEEDEGRVYAARMKRRMQRPNRWKERQMRLRRRYLRIPLSSVVVAKKKTAKRTKKKATRKK